MKLDVVEVRRDPGDIVVATLRHPRRPLLPAATAGAHVDLHLPDGRVRQYSLCGDPGDRSVYRVAVKQERGGRGGSLWLHENMVAGGTLMVSAPRNHFELSMAAERTILLAGGIGITPLLAMAHALSGEGRRFELHVFARSRTIAPLLGEIGMLDSAAVHTHFSDESRLRFDLASYLETPVDGAEIYCCGPARFMEAVQLATESWPTDAVHFEAFQPLLDTGFTPEPFDIVLGSTGATISVPAERTALDMLRDIGIELPSSCLLGVCGSCECGYLDGTPIHRDVVLSPRARRDRFIPCVSRAVGPLRLDL